ncbi:hypothetical protein HW555_007787 [Spodoptera exigua]|uniref:Uncharacterized protein n=1 Tax=Spodoptera exigua TaxID=7107 RepID=A0A835L519_SPOEX|nr:hypothetical protein HW555_007787 [Spodoptera exigua]
MNNRKFAQSMKSFIRVIVDKVAPCVILSNIDNVMLSMYMNFGSSTEAHYKIDGTLNAVAAY